MVSAVRVVVGKIPNFSSDESFKFKRTRFNFLPATLQAQPITLELLTSLEIKIGAKRTCGDFYL